MALDFRDESKDFENQQRQVVELEAPITLAEGQNFFDQEPFRTIAAKYAQQQNMPVSHVYEIIGGRLGKDLLHNFGSRKRKAELRELSAEIAGELNEYPYWSDYLTQFDRDFYNGDGSYRAQRSNKAFVPTESYAKWTTDKLARESKLKTAGIEEIFPQDFPNNSRDILGALAQGHEKRENRRWRILKAAELVKK